MPSLRYEQWDVFTHRPLSGNQLAVFEDGTGLSTAQMLAITREMNFSESTFFFPDAAAKAVKTRIFTRDGEVPFAGHPTLGAAMSLYRRRPAKTITLDLAAGLIPVVFEHTKDGPFGDILQNEPVFAETHPVEAIAPLIGVKPGQIDGRYPIENVSTGRPNLILMLDSLASIQAVSFNWPAIRSYFASGDKQRGFYLLTRETESREAQFHARKMTANGEDPATGSAAGSAAAWVVKHKLVASGERFAIEQGNEMHRPSRLYCQASLGDGKVTGVRVGGHAVLVAAGTLTL